jgi:hypothetical protein
MFQTSVLRISLMSQDPIRSANKKFSLIFLFAALRLLAEYKSQDQ